MMAAVFIAYLLLLLVVGGIAARYGRTMEGFFLADRRLGPWVTAISATASSESGWLVIGLVGEAYMWGAKAVWTACGVLLGYVANWYVVAPRLRAEAKRLGAITVPDFLALRFGDRHHALRLAGVVVIVLCLTGYVAAQLTAAGKAFQGAFGISYQVGVLLGAAITIFYTLVGGFRAVSWTDLAQGLLMVIGLAVLPLVTIAHVGGPGALQEKLAATPARTEAVLDVTRGANLEQIGVGDAPVTLIHEGLIFGREETETGHRFMVEGPAYTLVRAGATRGSGTSGLVEIHPGDEIRVAETRIAFDRIVEMVGGEDLLDPFGGTAGAAMLGWVIGLFGIGLGYPGQPHILARFKAASSGVTIRHARLIALVWGVIVMYGAIWLGHAARVALPDLLDPEQAYPVLATELMPPILAGILLAAIVAAMMSTADSQLLVVSSAVVRDVIERIVAPRTSERALGRISRLTVLVVGLTALGVALADVRAVFWFVLFAWSGLGAAFGPPILMALFWRRTSWAGALAGVVSGTLVTVLWKLELKDLVASATGLSLYELVPAFAVSMLLTWAVSLWKPAR
jgi:Na+/proline symporter